MATKTISLELDAYERLKRAKRGNESFSSVVRRARFEPEASTGAAILEDTAALYAAGNGITRENMDYLRKSQAEGPRVSPSHWESP